MIAPAAPPPAANAVPPVGSEPRLDEPHPRLKVQARASHTIRRHFVRALRRVTVLAIVDFALLLAASQMIRGLRSAAWAPSLVVEFFPVGFFGGLGSHIAVVVGLVFVGAYGTHERWATSVMILKGVALGAGIALWQSIDSRGPLWAFLHWAVVASGVGIAFTVARRLLHRSVLLYRRRTQSGDRLILVGDPHSPEGLQAGTVVLSWPAVQYLGWLSERVDVEDYLGHPSAVWEVLHETRTDTVVLCDRLSPEIFETVVEAAAVAGCKVLCVPSRAALMAGRPRPMGDHQLEVVELTFPAGLAGRALVKRGFDLAVSTVLLVALAPLFLLIALLVRLDSKGPVLFVQQRVGKAGHTFPMIKFRTMRVGADEEKLVLAHLNHTGDARLFKIPNDPRVTRVGAFLRRWSLDELPQLVNVWLGQMSLVGPRPFFASDLAEYDDHHFIRLAVKPGVTGLWQVRGRSSIVNFDKVVELDREYVERSSIRLDMQILFRTLPAVLRRTGAF